MNTRTARSRQHGLIGALAELLPTAIVGDDLQAIFGFDPNDPLADWDGDVRTRFPVVNELATPWRWINAGTRPLGEWLLSIRENLIQGIPFDLREAPPEVKWAELDGLNNEAIRIEAGSVAVGEDEKVLIVGDSRSPRDQRAFARKVPGAVTVEAVDLRDLTQFGESLDVTKRDALPIIATYAEDLMSAFSGQDLLRSVAQLRKGELGRQPSDMERHANAFVDNPSLSKVADLLASINRAGGVRCHRPAVLAATQRALQLAAGHGAPSFREATITIREQARMVGRPLAKRSVGSTLLLKGLEAEVAVILNPAELDARNLYVAMTRGSKRLIICSTDPVIKRSI